MIFKHIFAQGFNIMLYFEYENKCYQKILFETVRYSK